MTEYMVFLRIIEPNDGKKNIVADDLSGLQKPPNSLIQHLQSCSQIAFLLIRNLNHLWYQVVIL